MMENLPIPICATVMHQLQPIENKEDTIGASMTIPSLSIAERGDSLMLLVIYDEL